MILIETCPVCGHDLLNTVITTFPPIPRKECPSCGWFWEGEQEKVVRVPFGGNSYVPPEKNLPDTANFSLSLGAFTKDACLSCPSNPKNGGDGICFCTLGQQTFY